MKRVFHVLLVVFYMVVQVQMALAVDASDRPEDVKPLIAKIIAAYGGEKVVERTTGVHAVGDINAFMRHDRGTYELSFKRPGKLRVDTKYQRSFETRILNGNKGYRGTDEAPLAQVKDQRLLAMVYQYKHFDILYGLSNGLYSVSRKGNEDLNGNRVEVLHLLDQEGPPMDAYVDARTFLIVKVTGYFVMPGGQTTTLSSEFSDFRKVADTVFPFTITSYAGGQKIAETTMRTYSINPAIPDSLFAP
jgi:outer membrane lipoprotein-sorting protein